MKIAVLGTGVVGQTLSTKFSELGHSIEMVTRDPEATSRRTEPNPQSGISFSAWHARHPEISLVSLSGLSPDFDLLVNATGGMYSMELLKSIGHKVLSNNIIVDVSNPLDFSKGWPPSLAVCNTDSLGEQIQREFTKARVVKALNTLNYQVMIAPELVPGNHNLFVSGNDADAKATIRDLLEQMGWPGERILDLGGIETARGTEMMMPMWLNLMGVLGTPVMNFEIRRP